MLLEGSTNEEPPNKLPLYKRFKPVDFAENPWSDPYVYNSGNLVLDLLYNLMLECTGRLRKCRIYAMSDNKSFGATVSYFTVRDLAT